MPDDKLLHIISNETKNSIDQLSIVTPTMYASIFDEYASAHNTKIEDETSVAKDLLNSACSSLTALQTQASKSAQDLSKHTNEAINAIKEKDESKLNQVLIETQKLRQEIEKLKESVYKDELTNVYNRKWLHDTQLNDDTNNFNDDGILVMIDLNYFKIINDTHGHIIGDKVLIFIANELKKTKQKVVRYGGDEFILLFPNKFSKDETLNKLTALREDVMSKKLKAHNALFKTSFSIGVKEFVRGDDLSLIIESADKNMYEDKIAIKKRVTGIEV